jgi:hypothetical protein
MRHTKYIERCFHTGVAPELIKQLKHPIMLSVMPICPLFWLPWLEEEISVKSVCVCLSHHLFTQLNNLWKILERRLRHCFPTAINKTSNDAISPIYTRHL